MEEEARKQAENEARGLKIGDTYEGFHDYLGYFRIGYLDATRKHGFAYRVKAYKTNGPRSTRWTKSPTCAQLLLLYANKRALGLYGEYWSGDIAKRQVNGWGDWSEDWYYTINFLDGSKQKRRCGTKDPPYEVIEIYEF